MIEFDSRLIVGTEGNFEPANVNLRELCAYIKEQEKLGRKCEELTLEEIKPFYISK